MRRPLIAAVCALAWRAYAAEPFYIEDPALTRLPQPVEAVVKATLATDTDMRACSLVGRKVQLADDARVEGFLVTTRPACGWGAAVAPLWLAWGNAAGYKAAALSGGYSVDVMSKSHRGMRNVVVRTGTAREESTVTWKFDGREYREGRRATTDLTR